MTPSVLMCSTSQKRDFTLGNSGFFLFACRGIFRCRPKPDAKDLTETGKRVICTVSGTHGKEIPAYSSEHHFS